MIQRIITLLKLSKVFHHHQQLFTLSNHLGINYIQYYQEQNYFLIIIKK